MRTAKADVARLQSRLKHLEMELSRLRSSRQVLLNLMDLQDRRQKLQVSALQRENQRLRRHRRIKSQDGA